MRSEEEIRKAIDACAAAQRGGALHGDKVVVVAAGVAIDALYWMLGEDNNFQAYIAHVARAPVQAKKAWQQ